MMEFNVIGRGASSVVRPARAALRAVAPLFKPPLPPVGGCADVRRAPPPAQVKKAIHVPTHRFVALKCISVLDKARDGVAAARDSSGTCSR